MGNSNLLFESVFKRDLSSAGTKEYLTQITKEHPYFTPAQFFLLMLTNKESPEYEQQVAKTSLLFNNPHWLQFQLQETALATSEINNTIEEAKENELSLPKSEESITAQAFELAKPRDNPEEIITTITSPITSDAGPDWAQYEPYINTEIEQAQSFPDEEQDNFSPAMAMPITVEDNIIAAVSMEQPITETGNPGNKIAEEKQQEVGFNEVPVLVGDKETESALSDDSTVATTGYTDELVESSLPAQFINKGVPLINEAESQEDAIPEQETEPLHFKLNINTTDVKEDTITFEPLHTTDYFASQGIKLSAEIQPTDKLGKQLKSFTEWLKTMKKVHTDQAPASNGPSELSIQKLAEKSNIEDGVITEAMADVLLQQGKSDKAIEVYKKLSLLNPSKSAYFAAKIDQLKEH